MTARYWFDGMYPAEAALVILHPNFSSQHLLLPLFLNRENTTPICLMLHSPQTALNQIWQLLADVLSEQTNITLPQLAANASPQAAAQTVLKALKSLQHYTLFIDAFDLADQEAVCLWITEIAKGLPKGCQVVLGGRRLPVALLDSYPRREDIALFPIDEERMLLNYIVQSKDRTLLEVYGHGPGHVLVNGRLIEQWDGMLPRALFFYFIDRGMATRDEIFQTFWPMLPVREATNVFHVTKRKISEILGFDLTVYWSGFYRISPDVDFHYDVVKFAEAVQNSAVADEPTATHLLQQALYVYHGTFLSTLSGAWVEARRADLQATYVEALTSLARLRERDHREQEALGLYLRAAANQPHREDLARSIMSLYRKLEQPGKAIEIYDRLANELKQRLNVTPDRRTIELADQIRATV